MNRDWLEHQRLLREDRVNGHGSDDRERPSHYGRDPLDEVYEPAPGIGRVTRAREDDSPMEEAA